MKNKIFSYVRISTSKQKIERQISNISRAYPDADIYTGTKSNRPEWKKLLKELRCGDTIVFDSVSRMSRNADEGFSTYMELYNKGINLVFLKESTINTDSFKSVLGNAQLSFTVNTHDKDTDDLVNGIMEKVAVYITKLAEKQIRLAFEQAEKEVADLHQRTKEGMREAIRKGKKPGRPVGKPIVTKKSVEMKALIVKYHKSFEGKLNDKDTLAIIRGQTDGLSRNTYYQYKKQLVEELITDCENVRVFVGYTMFRCIFSVYRMSRSMRGRLYRYII